MILDDEFRLLRTRVDALETQSEALVKAVHDLLGALEVVMENQTKSSEWRRRVSHWIVEREVDAAMRRRTTG